jgi:hypothetical protein
MTRNDLLTRIWRERCQDFFYDIIFDFLKRLMETTDIAFVILNISMKRNLKIGLTKYEDYVKYLVSFTQYFI